VPNQIEDSFPNLAASGYQITSPQAEEPNCVGWALNDGHCWDPLGLAQGTHYYYWLSDLPPDFKIETISELFSRYHFEGCSDGSLESGFEKIAMYYQRHKGEITHVARQLPNGHWTSKLGGGEDIEHNDLHALSGELGHSYGTVIRFMRRAIT
jgi:hypothetical protein